MALSIAKQSDIIAAQIAENEWIRTKRVLESIAAYPSDWRLTPARTGVAYRPNWNSEPALSLKSLNYEITKDRADGIVLRNGNGILAVDLDGYTAGREFVRRGNGAISPTRYSGTPGRAAIIYKLSPELKEAIEASPRGFHKLRITEGLAAGEAIELLYENTGLTLPPSYYPKLDHVAEYKWRFSPVDVAVAQCPQWIEDLIYAEISRSRKTSTQQKSGASIKVIRVDANKSDWIDHLKDLLDEIGDPDQDYDRWVAVGQALHAISDEYFHLWDDWSARGAKYKPGQCDRLWAAFDAGRGRGLHTLYELAEWTGARWQQATSSTAQGFATAPSLAAQARDKLIAARMRSFNHYWGFLQTDFTLTATAKRTIRYYEGFCKQFELNAPTILIRGFLGAGKTQATLESIAERSKTAPIVWLAPRNGLLQQTIARAERMGIDCHYMQADNPLHREMLRTGQPGMYLMCPDSLKDYATGETPWYGVTVVLDEFQGQRGEVLSKAASLPEFERMMRECQCLIAADAFLGDADARIISSYRKGDRVIYDQTFTQSSTPVRWFESRTKDGKISMRHDGMVLALIRKAWSEGRKRIAVSLDNRMQILTIERLLKQDGIPVVAIESHRPDSNQLVMLSPDSYLDETLTEGVFLYSPSAQSGLDVQTQFDVIILASTGTLPPLQLLQMQGRIRQRGELWVSCPRFSENTPMSISALDGDRMKVLSRKTSSLFEEIGAEGSEASWRWSAWQQAVDEIGKVFRSEYLQSLLEMFFERVTVEEIEVENRAIWQAESKRTRSLDTAEILLADLELGMRLRHGNKSPKNRVESFAADVAKLHDKFPSAVLEAQNQIAEAGCKTPEDACMLVDLIEVMLQLNSSRMQRLYLYWLAEKGENQDIDAILNSIQTRSTNLKSAHFKRLRAICAYRELGLKKLAKLAVSDKDVLVADTNCYWSGSPEIQAMWHQFQGSPDLRRLFPEVESPDEFMNAIRSTMRALGYQSVGHRARQKSEELHANGTDRNGSKRYSRSRVVYFTGWLLMECSGNAVFQDLWAAGLLEDIGDWVKRDRRFYQPIIEHSPPIAA